jgi:hypothetical protein
MVMDGFTRHKYRIFNSLNQPIKVFNIVCGEDVREKKIKAYLLAYYRCHNVSAEYWLTAYNVNIKDDDNYFS